MHLAIDTRSGRVCAVKIVDVDERAQRELELLQYINRIGQEHFVKLLGFFGTSGSQPAARKLCMVFPWYDINLHGLWHARSGMFSNTEAMDMAGDLFEGLVHLHDVSILHGNLNLYNLLARPDSASGSQPAAMIRHRVIIAGFGQAVMLPASEPPCCSTNVRAPEIWLQVPAASLTCAVDVWAAGILLASMATGLILCDSIATMVRMLGPLTDQVWPNVSTMVAYRDLDIAGLSASCDDRSGSQPGLQSYFSTASGGLVQGVPPSGGRLIPPAVLHVLQGALTWSPANRAAITCVQRCRSGPRQRDIREAIRRAPHSILARIVELQLIDGSNYSLAE